jgi:hemerythrin
MVDTLDWDPTFSVGNRFLDEQHKAIVSVINYLIVSKDLHVGSEAVSDSLTQLTRYFQEHFRFEERFLEKHGYALLADQKADHRAYTIRIAEFCGEAMAGNEAVPENLLQFLRDWWENHILIEDMKYREFMKGCGVK